jgi:hypothetical protein
MAIGERTIGRSSSVSKRSFGKGVPGEGVGHGNRDGEGDDRRERRGEQREPHREEDLGDLGGPRGGLPPELQEHAGQEDEKETDQEDADSADQDGNQRFIAALRAPQQIEVFLRQRVLAADAGAGSQLLRLLQLGEVAEIPVDRPPRRREHELDERSGELEIPGVDRDGDGDVGDSGDLLGIDPHPRHAIGIPEVEHPPPEDRVDLAHGSEVGRRLAALCEGDHVPHHLPEQAVRLQKLDGVEAEADRLGVSETHADPRPGEVGERLDPRRVLRRRDDGGTG